MKNALSVPPLRDPSPSDGEAEGEAAIPLADLAAIIGPCAVRGTLRGDCRGITHDSRRVRPGMVFAALPGGRTDGACFIEEAIERGAVAVLGRGLKRPRRRRPVFDVEAPRRALALAASALAGHPSARLTTVGVTGTNGKTSISFLLRDLLCAADRIPGLIGTLHYDTGARRIPAQRTTPEAPELQALLAEMVRSGCDHAVMEVSSHALAQDRVLGIDFDAVVFSNLTQDHLDFHGSMQAYFEAKARLFQDPDVARAGAVRVVNVDDPWGRKLALRLGSHDRLVTYGTCAEARVHAERIRLDARGTQAAVRTPWGDAELQISLPGRYNLLNALAALAAGGSLGIPLDRMVGTLAGAAGAPGRLERIANARGILLFVDYAHTEDALSNMLRTVRETHDGRLLCVFGCGGDRDRLKRPRMGAAATRWADVTILTSDNPRSEDPGRIIQDIAEGCAAGADVHVRADRREAIALALRLAVPGDAVVVAGKGHETTIEIGEQRLPFDDRAVLREVLAEPDGP
jgi:UDP-N-acetylmuramoyl-L-alanyl-D-glutamate--2,6-diaminopimelate ligase